MTPTDPDIQPLLAAAHFFRDGAESLTFASFAAVLNRTIGANSDYAATVFNDFQDNPAAFLASRNPQTQSEELIRAMIARLAQHQPSSTISHNS